MAGESDGRQTGAQGVGFKRTTNGGWAMGLLAGAVYEYIDAREIYESAKREAEKLDAKQRYESAYKEMLNRSQDEMDDEDRAAMAELDKKWPAEPWDADTSKMAKGFLERLREIRGILPVTTRPV